MPDGSQGQIPLYAQESGGVYEFMGTMPVSATPEDVSKVRRLLQFIESPEKAPAYLVDPSGQSKLELPGPLFQVLVAAARELAAGRSVVIFPYDAEVTGG